MLSASFTLGVSFTLVISPENTSSTTAESMSGSPWSAASFGKSIRASKCSPRSAASFGKSIRASKCSPRSAASFGKSIRASKCSPRSAASFGKSIRASKCSPRSSVCCSLSDSLDSSCLNNYFFHFLYVVVFIKFLAVGCFLLRDS